MDESKKYVSMEFDAKQMIRLLGNDLYDSPMAMLRENVQNAYDAILERRLVDNEFTPHIEVQITSQSITIKDNGIGMNDTILSNNYWRAGNSGKNTTEAQKAGVVGHFGIGALANFGVCSSLEITTKRFGEHKRYKSIAKTETLNKKDSISIVEIEDLSTAYGTEVIATLEHVNSISEASAISYLRPYVEYLDVQVSVNGKVIPQKQIEINPKIKDIVVNEGLLIYKLDADYGKTLPLDVSIRLSELKYAGREISGYIFLTSKNPLLMGLRNGFGLASIACSTSYGFGGVANLDILVPTAGREAISRESVSMVSNFIQSAEKQWTDLIAKDPICDNYREFISYVSYNYTDERVGFIKVKDANDNHFYCLNEITNSNANDFLFANNVDPSILQKYANSDKIVLSLTDTGARKRVQMTYLQKRGVKAVSNDVQVLKIFSTDEIDLDQYMILSELKAILEEDYYLRGFEIKWAKISHNIQFMVMPLGGGSFAIYLSPNCPELKHMVDVRKNDYRLFTPLAKDFVRMFLYQQFSAFMPKNQKDRTDYINRVLHNTKEELEIKYEQMGSMEEMIDKLRRKEITEEDFAKYAKAERNKHSQTINLNQVGDIEDVVRTTQSFTSSAHATEVRGERVTNDTILPMPPILCLDNSTSKLLLKAEDPSPVLNNNMMFMALSNKMVNQKRIFFTNPHTTRVIWSMRKLIYLFTDAVGQNTLYYDMELDRKIPDSTGGKSILSTTIITKDKIFVPIVPELYDYFNIREDQKLKFYIHFDELENT